MDGQLKLKLEILPGAVKVTGEAGKAAADQKRPAGPVQTLQAPCWTDEQKREVLHYIAEHPGELYELLQGRLSGGLAGYKVLPADEEWTVSGADHEAPDSGRLPEKIRRQLAEEPLLGFALRGLDKEELLSGVFALWAEEENDPGEEVKQPPAGTLAAELARLERKGPAVSTGEWLAEAAAEGSLHQPGPLFHEIAARPFPASPVIDTPPERWSDLLHATPRAEEGLVLIMRRVAEAAARKAANLDQ
ncbi:hypothetical protein C2I18_14630 [Paenibacillus sp. PK3_47]|uniref:hypothetical protein n=1 Tax=Paenibacillus sp. PK3_47 TaxID=2072642 RepID=UPI00201E3D88|nr:hypothetical protein [Paenibacillus sp. PK3_47]UQZ34651.1 hypothetical protein C2I18_14630 [Paenibacillus sp. PK3_47]